VDRISKGVTDAVPRQRVAPDGSQTCDAPPPSWNGRAAAEVADLRRRNAELEAQLEKIVEANRGLRQALAEAAHELAEPLVIVESAALQCKAAIGRPNGAAAVKGRLDAIGSVAARGRLLVESLLHDARSVEQPPRLERFDVKHTVADAVELVRDSAAARRLRISVDTMPTVVCNPELLSIVMRNLLVNAVKYSSGQAREIRVTADRERRAWRLSVVSPGQAVASEDVDRILHRFTRAEPGRTRGMGLGLAICVRIMERLGGTFGVAPMPGVGNRFFLVIPDVPALAYGG
jgi:signal transduction histidine kinase